MDFKVGDVVELRSGGAAMTIEALAEAGRQAHCVWQVQTGGGWETRRDVFTLDALVPRAATPAPSLAGLHADDPDERVYEEGDD